MPPKRQPGLLRHGTVRAGGLPLRSTQNKTMKRLATTLVSTTLLGLAFAQANPPTTAGAQQITILRNGSQASAPGSADYFTGAVRVDPMFAATAPSRMSAGHVTFEPGARSAWHTHPVGQVLVVTSGLGRVQMWGGRVEDIRPGDVVRIPPGLKHWHGASPAVAMTHIALQEGLNGKAVDWLEKVSDAQYGR